MVAAADSSSSISNASKAWVASARATQHRPRRRPVEQRPGGADVKQRGSAAHHAVQPLGGDVGLRIASGAGLTAVKADRDGQVGVDPGDRRHRQWIQDSAVGQQASVDFVWGDHPGYGDGRPDRRVEGAALKPHRLAGQ